MRVRFFVGDEPEVHEVPLADVPTFLMLLKSMILQDGEGSNYKVDAVVYDMHQHAFDVTVVEEAG